MTNTFPILKESKAFLSRSKIECAASCNRKMYYEYLFAGRGLRPNPGPIYFDTGSAVHEGLATALEFIQGGHYVPFRSAMMEPTQEAVDTCITIALRTFDRSGVPERPPEFPERVWAMEIAYRAEQRDLVAALVYAWCVEEWVPFAQRYEVIAVEQDLTFRAIAPGIDGRPVELIYESRADAVVRERLAPNAIANISWKTAQDTSEWTRKRYRSDLQGFLECYFVQLSGLAETVDYNQVIYLVKGKKQRIGANGEVLKWGTPFESVLAYQTDTFLLYPHLPPEGASEPFFNLLADVRPNVMWSNSHRKPGNQSDSYLKGWTRPERFTLDDLDESGRPHLLNWIDELKANRIFPTLEYANGEAPLNKAIVWETASARNDNLTAELLKEISFKMARMHSAFGPQVEIEFDRNLKACDDAPPDAQGKAGCPFKAMCWSSSPKIGTEVAYSSSDANEPPNGFIWRTPHHASELAAIGLE